MRICVPLSTAQRERGVEADTSVYTDGSFGTYLISRSPDLYVRSPGRHLHHPCGDRTRSEDGEAAGSISSFYHSISNMDYTVCICSQLFVMRHDDERLVHLVS